MLTSRQIDKTFIIYYSSLDVVNNYDIVGVLNRMTKSLTYRYEIQQ